MDKKIVVINGSYRKGGITDQAIESAVSAVKESGAETNIIKLREKNIEFCANCRICVQKPGPERGTCVLNDDMNDILNELETADGIILAAPVNCYNINALTRKFYERLICYFYWPWGAKVPKFRKKVQNKKSVLITSSAMPAFMGVIFTGAIRALKGISKTLGFKPCATVFIGLSSMEKTPKLAEKNRKKLKKAAVKL